jgi:hypothetical protein
MKTICELDPRVKIYCGKLKNQKMDLHACMHRSGGMEMEVGTWLVVCEGPIRRTRKGGVNGSR